MIAKEGIRQSFQRRFDVNYRDKLKSWWYHFNTLMSMIATQATGVPTGNHGLFHRYLIKWDINRFAAAGVILKSMVTFVVTSMVTFEFQTSYKQDIK